MQISFCFCKICICLKSSENIQISVNMIDRLNITDEYSVKCDFILNTVIFIDAAINLSLRKFWKCNVLWFCLFGQGVPNETKGTINLKEFKRGCIKCLFKIQYECVNLSSIFQDFSPIIYYSSQLSFTTMSFPECMLPIWQEFIFIKMSHDIWTYYVFE